MSFEHADLAAGRWGQFTFLEQMAHIGSEVERALRWRSKNNFNYSQKASERALELMDLSLDNVKGLSRLKELARTREALVDYFFGTNQFLSDENLWRKQFAYFTYAARKNN